MNEIKLKSGKTVKIDEEIEVTQQQYEKAVSEFSGFIAHRFENGKFFIKIWSLRYSSYVVSSLGL